MKEDDLYQKTRGNMVFSVYMRRRYKHDIAPPPRPYSKKTKTPFPQKNTPKGHISGITEKKILILEDVAFLLKHHVD